MWKSGKVSSYEVTNHAKQKRVRKFQGKNSVADWKMAAKSLRILQQQSGVAELSSTNINKKGAKSETDGIANENSLQICRKQ